MRNFLSITIVMSLSTLASANTERIGFKTTEDLLLQKTIKEEKILKDEVSQIIGKDFWYNSNNCSENKIYQTQEEITKNGAVTYSTDEEYLKVKFLDAKINNNERHKVTYKVELQDGAIGYVRPNMAMYRFIDPEKPEPIGCFYVNKPKSNKRKNIDLNKAIENFKNEGSWFVRCEKDKFNGSKICSLSKEDLLIMIYNGNLSILVGNNHYPKSNSYVRVDNNKTINGYEGRFTKQEEIIDQLKRGNILNIRYQEWPYKYNKDSEIDLKNFTKKYNEMWEDYKKL